MGSLAKQSTSPSFSRQTLETLIDLIDNKLTSMEVVDRDDQRELTRLQATMGELERYLSDAPVVSEPGRRGRRPKSIAAATL
ncbi:MAG: hypothetical protein KI792_04745 [Alphaproteobacteria bacterium]|nr:hypothetical protein [Alphaproteobacteria bacterium SS10]